MKNKLKDFVKRMEAHPEKGVQNAFDAGLSLTDLMTSILKLPKNDPVRLALKKIVA